jgi:hypothetical protein
MKGFTSSLRGALFLSMIALLSFGCKGGGSTDTTTTGVLTLVHSEVSAIKTVGQETIDSVEIVGYPDPYGPYDNPIYGPVRVPLSAQMVRTDVPLKVKSVTVDYLRNGGYPLKVTTFATDFEDDGVHVQIDPALQSHEQPKTVWKAQMAKDLITVNGTPFTIKGMCYSPAPIGYNVRRDQDALGDLFWDVVRNPNNRDEIWSYNWYALWGNGRLYDDYFARDDLKTMRDDLGVNAIRVYGMMSRQAVKGVIPADPVSGYHFTHADFLDKCYNNGNNPIYVLVGIPMPEALFKKYDSPPPDINQQQKFWEYMLDETTKDLADHPAVLGFIIMNEAEAEPFSHGNNVTAENKLKKDHFYYRSIQYAKTVKANARDKLVGWAPTDVPPLYKFAAENTFSAGDLAGKIYLVELAKAFDFWGVNTYQKENLESVLGDLQNPVGLSFRQLPADTKKPVIFTEIGWPATGREGDAVSGKIKYDDANGANTAKFIERMIGMAYGVKTPEYSGEKKYADLFAGAFYFSFSDEWWKSENPTQWNTTPNLIAENWPNKFNDQEGYGLYGVKRGSVKGVSLSNDAPIWCSTGPCLPVDEMVPRLPLTGALSKIYKSLP